jgi:hypothetical protein
MKEKITGTLILSNHAKLALKGMTETVAISPDPYV